MSNTNSIFTDNTYSLSKGLHSINIAKQYFEDVKIGASKEVKSIFSSYINKCDWILNDVKVRLDDESREVMNNDLKDSLVFESIKDKLVYINSEQRLLIENILEEMVKGEDVRMMNDDKKTLA